MEPMELDNGEKVLTCFLFPQGNPREIEGSYILRINIYILVCLLVCLFVYLFI